MGGIFSKHRRPKNQARRNKTGDTPYIVQSTYDTAQILPEKYYQNVSNVPTRKHFCVALYDFEKRTDDELSFKKGEQLELLAKDDSGWWKAKVDNRVGLIPSNYVRLDDDSPENTDGYMNVCRREAVRLLLLPYVEHGQYIVRPSTEVNNLALSVRLQGDDQMPKVVHYKFVVQQDKSVFVRSAHSSGTLAFQNFNKLLEHYSKEDGLACRLQGPCPRSRPPNVPLQAVEVPRCNLEKLNEIGRGNFGAVYFGKLNRVIEVAIKEALPTNTMTKEELLAEAESMHKVVHDKIVQLIGVCTKEMPLLIITEYMPNGDLNKYLRKLGSAPFESAEEEWNSPSKRFNLQVSMLEQIGSGMQHLESLNLLHRDLRSANVLVGKYNEVKVADFGLAKLMDSGDVYYGAEATKLPIRWSAPEVLVERRFSVKSDVWSFGVLAYEIITMGGNPYSSMNNSEVMSAVKMGETMKLPHDGVKTFCPPRFYHDVMASCWNMDPNQRPSFQQLCKVLDKYETPADEERFIKPEERLDAARQLRNKAKPEKYVEANAD